MRFTKNTIPSLALSAALLVPGLAMAQDAEVDNRFNIYAGPQKYLFQHSKQQQNDAGMYFGMEMPVAERWSLAFERWELDSWQKDQQRKNDLRWLRSGVNYHLNKWGNWQPYVAGGVGKIRLQPSVNSPKFEETAYDLGFGIKRYLSENLVVKADIKTSHGEHSKNLDTAMGLSFGFAFGGSSRPAPPPPPPPPAVVQDPDSDGDGVPDSRDRCPNTPRELAVDADGCPILETSQLQQELLVNFDFDRSDIRPEFEGVIREFADFMRTYTNTNAVIEGHTDSTGPETYNQGLSERRANAVMNALIQRHNIPASRLSAVGYGESRPVAPNDSAQNRALNRRIEAEITVEIETEVRR